MASCCVVSQVGCQVDWLVGGLVGVSSVWLVDSLSSWWVGCLVGWLICVLIVWMVFRLARGMDVRFIGRLVGCWLADWLVGGLVVRSECSLF